MTPLPFSVIFVLLVQATEFRPKVHEDTAGSSWVTSVTVKCGKIRTSGVKSGNLVGLLARDVAGSVVKFLESEIHFSHHDDFSADRQSGVRAEKQD